MEKLVLMVLGMSLEAAVAVCAVLLLRFLFRRLPRSYSYALWFLVLFRLLCPVTLSSSLSLMPGSTWQEEAIGGSLTADSYDGAEVSGQSGFAEMDSSAQPQGGDQLTSGTARELQPDFGGDGVQAAISRTVPERIALLQKQMAKAFGAFWNRYGIWLSLVWLAGAVWLTAAYLVQYAKWKEMLRGCAKAALSESTGLPQKGHPMWKKRSQSAYIVESERIGEPFVCGVFKPVIYLPAGMAEKERNYILRHEWTHIRHRDPLIGLLWQAALVIHWFNPMVWLAVSLVQKDMEMYCDESVMKQCGNGARREYAMTLLQFSMKKSGLPFPVAFGESNTESRIRHILKQKKPAVAASVLAVVVIALAAVALLTNPKAPRDGGSVANAQGTEAQNGDGQSTVAQNQNGQSADGQNQDAQSGEEQSAESQSRDAQSEEAQNQGADSTESGTRSEEILALAQRWAKASSDRNGSALAEMVSDPEKMADYRLEDGSYAYGWSSPWPWSDNARIVYAYDRDEVIIHYYANTSDPHVWPWREVLTVTRQDGKWMVEDWNLNTEAVRSAAQFKERFYYESPEEYGGDSGWGYRFKNTPLDAFYQSEGDEAWVYGILRNAERYENLAEQWETPERAAAAQLYLEGGQAVEVESPWENKVCLRWEFEDGMTDVICLCHPAEYISDGGAKASELWVVENIVEEAVYIAELKQTVSYGE